MSLVALRSAIVSSIGTEVSTFKTVQAHGGKFNREELKRWAIRSPACLVAVLGGPVRRDATQAAGEIRIVAFIVARGTSAEQRDEIAPRLAEVVVGLVNENKWAYADAQAPMDMRIDNLYSGAIDKLGVALWSVSWNQSADLAIFSDEDLAAMDDLHRANVKWDLAQKDGITDMEDDIWLNGEFMSAFGHLYVSTSAATSIAIADTYQKAAGTTTLKTTPTAVDFDMPANNRLCHTGTVVKPFLVSASASITVSGDAKVTLALAEDGVVDEDTEIEQEITTAGGAEIIPLRGIFNLDNNEYVEVWVKADDTINVTLTKLNVIAAST